MSKKTLQQTLRKARNDYYNNSSSELTDDEYDALEEELRLVDPDNDLLKEVGVEPQSHWPKVKHSIPMGSLFKVQNVDQWSTWFSKFPDYTLFAVTEKFDGISVSLEYKNGKLVKALTRGDGVIGEDITPNVLKMKNVKEYLLSAFTGWLRGEIVLLKSDHKTYMSDKKNPRNAASGTAKRLDGVGCEHLTVQYYELYDENDPPYSLTSQYNKIDSFGLTTTTCMSVAKRPDNKLEIPTIVDAFDKNRDDIDYLIDGLVIRLNHQSEYEECGVTDGRPKGAIAYKFPPIKKVTTVVSVTWQVGKTGRLTPVAELEPVDIGGVTIKRASLHTARMALDLQAGNDAKVVISRRNDVIPYIEKVLSPPTSPVVQPTNFGELKWDGEYLVVTDLDNNLQLYNSIKVWTERAGVLHWGKSFINKLIENNLVSNLPDIYKLDWDKVSDICGDGIAKRAKLSLESHKTMDFATFISALNLRYCNNSAEDLVKNGIDSVNKLLSSNVQQIQSFDGFGSTKALEIRKSIENKRDEITEIEKFVVFQERTGTLVGKSFCFTGTMNNPRNMLSQLVLNNGGEIKKSVSKGLDYLVMSDPSSGSTKAKKAQKLGTSCISEQEFLNMCEA